MRVPWPVRHIPAVTFEAWLTPPPIGEKALERDRVATADLTPFLTGGRSGYEVGSGPLALALHGWGGRPAQMADVARRLADAGHRVIAPELPGHAGGEATDIKKAAAAVREIVDHEGMPEIVVAHSFASMVMRLAFAETAPARIVMFAPALDVKDALSVFGDRLDLTPWAQRGLRKRLESWDRSLWPTVSSLLPDQFPGAEMLIVHDPEDPDTPFGKSAELAALRGGTSLVVADGVGHSRILTDQDILHDVVAWMERAATAS